MRSFLLAACAAVFVAVAAPAPAQSGRTVALLPAHVFKGAAGNGPVVTAALRAHLQRNGFTVLPADRVQGALRQSQVNVTRIIPVASLAKVRSAAGANYVVYPRVLGVGVGVNAQEFQATTLVNVLGPTGNSFLHTRQIGQVFRTTTRPSPRETEAVIGQGAASELAGKLLEGFYTKASNR